MNKQEALRAMKDGKKICHEYYSDKEYLYINPDNGNIHTEDGVDCGTEQNVFWTNIQKWEAGWSIYNPKN